MAHIIQCIVGSDAALEKIAADWLHAKRVSINLGYSLIPLTNELLDDMNELANIGMEQSSDAFQNLSKSVEHVLKESAYSEPIGYLETEYCGGIGTQSAICYFKGKVLKGPLVTTTRWDHKMATYLRDPKGEGAINCILYELGLEKRGDMDAFDSLKLGSYRSNQQLLSTLRKD